MIKLVGVDYICFLGLGGVHFAFTYMLHWWCPLCIKIYASLPSRTHPMRCHLKTPILTEIHAVRIRDFDIAFELNYCARQSWEKHCRSALINLSPI